MLKSEEMKRKLKRNDLLVFLTAVVILTSCREVSVPKPEGYFRIDLPDREYLKFSDSLSKSLAIPLSFEYPAYGKINRVVNISSDPGWFNIDFPAFRSAIYLTYKRVNNDLEELMEETYRLNIKNHISKADAIKEMVIRDSDRRVYGILYDLKGNTATAVQFFVTDSTNHYLRGSLYFDAEPNPDSIAPVSEFFRQDIIHLIETLEWKDK